MFLHSFYFCMQSLKLIEFYCYSSYKKKSIIIIICPPSGKIWIIFSFKCIIFLCIHPLSFTKIIWKKCPVINSSINSTCFISFPGSWMTCQLHGVLKLQMKRKNTVPQASLLDAMCLMMGNNRMPVS